MPETAGFLPTSDTEARRTFFSTRPKYIKAGPSKVRMATSDSNLGPSPEVLYKLRLEAQEIREKNLTRQLAAKGAVSINALARKVAVDEALIGYTSSDPASKYIHCDHGLVQEFQKNPGAHSLPLANTITNNISIHSNLTCHSISFNQSMTYLINCQW